MGQGKLQQCNVSKIFLANFDKRRQEMNLSPNFLRVPFFSLHSFSVKFSRFFRLATAAIDLDTVASGQPILASPLERSLRLKFMRASFSKTVSLLQLGS